MRASAGPRGRSSNASALGVERVQMVIDNKPIDYVVAMHLMYTMCSVSLPSTDPGTQQCSGNVTLAHLTHQPVVCCVFIRTEHI